MTAPVKPTTPRPVSYDDQRIACDFLEDHGFAPAVVAALRETIDRAEGLLARVKEPAGNPRLSVRLRERLEFNPTVSNEYPVIIGTWVTAYRIADLISHGFMRRDILRAHPGITEDDIRACIAYANDPDNE